MVYGKNARVGSITVFSREGAIKAFKNLARLCYRNLTMEASIVLTNAADDMYALGFTLREVEALEISVIE